MISPRPRASLSGGEGYVLVWNGQYINRGEKTRIPFPNSTGLPSILLQSSKLSGISPICTMSDYSDVFGHTRRTTRQQGQQGQQSQRPSSMGERMGMSMDEDEPAWEPGHPTQHEWGGESGWGQTRRSQGGMTERSMQGAGYTMPGQTYPQTGGTQRYGGPTTRSQGRATRVGEEEWEPEDISKVYSEESYGRPSAGSHEGDYLQGSQRARQSRSHETGGQMGGQQGSEQHGSQ